MILCMPNAYAQPVEPVVSEFYAEGYDPPIVPESGKADPEYFTNAILIGDSLGEGFYLSRNIETLEVISKIGQSPQGVVNNRVYKYQGKKVKMIDILKDRHPKILYIWLGSNGVDKNRPDRVILQYETMLDLFISELPDTIIYCVSVAPVIERRAQRQYPKMTNERIHTFNQLMSEAAKARKVFYLPISDVLVDENGGLNKELSAGDGIHLSKEGYKTIAEYILTHTIPLVKE